MTDSSIIQALDAIKTVWTTAGLRVEIDRDESEILQQSEYPCTSLAWGGATIEMPDSCNHYRFRATIIADFWAQIVTGKTVIQGCTDMLSVAAASIQSDYSFGGKFENCQPVSVSDLANIGSDTGCITLTLEVLFNVPKGDWTTLL